MNGFLLDTNVVSELIRPKPEPKVTRWIDAIDEESLFLSVLTLGEIRKGICSCPVALAVPPWKHGSTMICRRVFTIEY